MDKVRGVRTKYEQLQSVMDERVTRLWAASEAQALGRGGIAAVVAATGISKSRIRAGIAELEEHRTAPPTMPAREQRVRRPGAGRPPLLAIDPTLLDDLDRLVEPTTRGDPESPLRWTCKSKEKLAAELVAMGHKVSPTKVGRLLHDIGFSLQVVRKTREGKQSPDRNAQFEHINRSAERFMARGQPVVSVDTKKKELIGDFKNGGREWQPEGAPVPVRVHDFIDKNLGKVIPYGVYDTARNDAWVSIGIDHDTAEFAVATLERWWREMGEKAYPNATELLVTADGGGSNAPRTRLWRTRRTATIRRCLWTRCHRLSFPARNQQMEQDRAPPLLTDHPELARTSARQPRDRRRTHPGNDDPVWATRARQPRHARLSAEEGSLQEQLELVSIDRDLFRGDWNYTVRSAQRER